VSVADGVAGSEAAMRTDDLFLGAFALSRGADLAGVEVTGVNGRRIAFFRIEGPGVADACREYHRGAATVDLRLLKSEVRRLKDAAFDAIRQEERRRDAGQQGRDRAHPYREPARSRRR
jgi:hypothetical protein